MHQWFGLYAANHSQYLAYPKHHVFALSYHLKTNRVGEIYLSELKELYSIMVTQRYCDLREELAGDTSFTCTPYAGGVFSTPREGRLSI